MEFTGTLRDYQKEVVEKALKHREGVIVMSTGSGKTITCLEIIARLGLTATILTPNTVLQDQWVKECQQLFGYDPGVINGKVKDIRGVTVSTFGSLLHNKELLQDVVENTSVLVVDEVHGAVTDKRLKVVQSFSPTYLYSCTATPVREDGKTEAIGFHFGDTVAMFHSKQLTPTVQVHIPGVDIDVDEYYLMIEQMVNNKSRNKLIMGCAIGEAIEGRKVLVLTKRKQHARDLADMFPAAILIESEDKGRNELLARLKRSEQEFSMIIGTTALLATGTDIPSLDTLVLACDMKSKILTTQSVGRILRLFEGKDNPKIIDFWDGFKRTEEGWRKTNPIFYNQFRERYKLYKAKDWPIENLYQWMEDKLT